MDTITEYNYICGGMLGDLIHLLYVIYCKYHELGIKGNLYITNDRKWGGDVFRTRADNTHKELFTIITAQPYINNFSVYNDENITFDYNLNDFRKNPKLCYDTWLNALAYYFNFTVIETPWISLPTNYINNKYEDRVLIHRSIVRHYPPFLSILKRIIDNNQCLFITNNINEYNSFPFKNDVPLELISTLDDMYTGINSCKFFICNQSSPLAMAYSINKPALCESTEGEFYVGQKHYDGFNWIDPKRNNLETLDKYVVI
jgi:hypothetical protein